MAGAKGRSGRNSEGAKNGALGGRPRTRKRSIDWAKVSIYAQAHAPENEIRLALDITDDLLGPAELEKFRATIARGHAVYRLALRREIHTRGKRGRGDGTDGSVNALALQARNTLDWDRQIPTQEVAPDLGTARARLGDLLLRLAQQTSAVEGRHVSVLDVINREANTTDPEDDGK